MSKVFDRILIVMFENQYRSYVMTDPFMRKLARAGMNMTNFFGCFHPSQTNYVASLAGELCAVTNDTPPAAPLMQQTLVDLMEPAGVSWKAYMEAMPAEPWNPVWQDPNYDTSLAPTDQFPDKGPDLARYFRKHNAFASFHTIQASAARWAKIVDDTRFWKDVAAGDLPDYGWFTPDIWNDGHYLYNTHIDTNPRTQLIPQMSAWLEHIFLGNIDAGKLQGGGAAGLDALGLNLDIDLLIADPAAAWAASRVPPGTLIVVTFDEADYDAAGYDTAYDGPNQIYTVLLGDMIEPGSTCDLPLNHYGLMRTVERNFDLGTLGKNDATANWVRPLWGESFAWSDPAPVNLTTGADFAVADMGGVAHMVYRSATVGGLALAVLADGAWVDQGHIAGVGEPSQPQALKLAGLGSEGLLLATVGDDGEICLGQYSPANSPDWLVRHTGVRTAGDIALAGYTDIADGGTKAMLAWQDDNGFIRSAVFSDGCLGEAVPVGALSDGPMALAQFGPSLFLVYKERNTRGLRVTSYNLAPFNAFKAQTFDDKPAPVNDTGLHQWAATDFPVGHFAKKFAGLQNDYRAWGNLALGAIDGEMRLVHRGAYADTPQAYEETFALTGILAPVHPYSNGYGGLDQAGWTAETELAPVQLDPGSAIGLTRDGEGYVLVWNEPTPRAKGQGRTMWMRGGYG
ncbi:MAG: alkaline phosphatase family protein [Rhodobacter sp.]|nr:alkaline phosphatase family protein [Rhodobacter sp.]